MSQIKITLVYLVVVHYKKFEYYYEESPQLDSVRVWKDSLRNGKYPLRTSRRDTSE